MLFATSPVANAPLPAGSTPTLPRLRHCLGTAKWRGLPRQCLPAACSPCVSRARQPPKDGRCHTQVDVGSGRGRGEAGGVEQGKEPRRQGRSAEHQTTRVAAAVRGGGRVVEWGGRGSFSGRLVGCACAQEGLCLLLLGRGGLLRCRGLECLAGCGVEAGSYSSGVREAAAAQRVGVFVRARALRGTPPMVRFKLCMGAPRGPPVLVLQAGQGGLSCPTHSSSDDYAQLLFGCP